MRYEVVRDKRYDFCGERYGEDCYPGIHKYPATMIPQIGIEVLQEFGISKGRMLDPYCGSGSSFASGVDVGMKDFTGFDLNPLAVLICRVRFTRLDFKDLEVAIESLRQDLEILRDDLHSFGDVEVEKFNNFDYWFDSRTALILQVIKNRILDFSGEAVRNFLFIALSSAMRECSYVRSNEFKLYRMDIDSMLFFSPDAVGIFFRNLEKNFSIYKRYYHGKLDDLRVEVNQRPFESSDGLYDVVLTSPPYGDSRTTVAYGQFSFFSNEWMLGECSSRRVDQWLMGGRLVGDVSLDGSLIEEYIDMVAEHDIKRAGEVLSFYVDLRSSICSVASRVVKGGKAIYVIGNRTVKGVRLPSDQFIAEIFSSNGFKHLVSYERLISNKRMPSLNSPSNRVGRTGSTMTSEYIVVCEKQV